MYGIVDLIICGLATWRLAVLLVDETGPWDIFRRLRQAFGVIHDDDGTPVSWPDGMPGSLFSCAWCMSVWLAPISLIAWWFLPVVVFVLAVAGSAAVLEGIVRRRS